MNPFFMAFNSFMFRSWNQRSSWLFSANSRCIDVSFFLFVVRIQLQLVLNSEVCNSDTP